MDWLNLFVLILAIAVLMTFGWALANERLGALWSFAIVIMTGGIASFITAIVNREADALTNSFEEDFAFNVMRLASFVLGYQIGYTRKKSYWKTTLVITLVTVAILASYVFIA